MSLKEEANKLLGRNAESLTRLIMINVIVFIIANILNSIPGTRFLLNYVSLPYSFALLARYPWTLFTYMFVHVSFMHIFSNMLWLYWIGIIFSDFMGQRRLVYTYILGGIAGGLLYVATFPLLYPVPFIASPDSYPTLIGASAGVMAVIVAAAILVPDYELMLLLLGRVKLKYLALGAFILSSVIDFSVNSGGKIAHFGGALYGILFITQYKKGTDISGKFGDFIESIGRFLTFKRRKKKPKSKGKVVHMYDKQRRIDEILDKISRSGYDSLSKDEKDFLFKSSKDNKA